MTYQEKIKALSGTINNYDEVIDDTPGYFDYDDPRDYEEWCDWNDIDLEEGYYDPFQPDVEGRFVSPGTAFGMDTDTVVVASVVCEAKNVDLQISELLGLYGNIGSGPGTLFSETGDMLPMPDFVGDFDPGPGEPLLESGVGLDMPNFVGDFDILQMPDFVSAIDPGPRTTSPESGDILAMPDFVGDFDPGPGEVLPYRNRELAWACRTSLVTVIYYKCRTS